MIWQCQDTQECRDKCHLSAEPARHLALRTVGLFLEREKTRVARALLEQMPALPAEPQGEERSWLDGVIISCGVIEAWTDGACTRQGEPRWRRGGAGVRFGHSHPANQSLPLGGPDHSSVRAKAAAIAMALECVPHEQRVASIADSQLSWAKLQALLCNPVVV